MKRIAFNLLGHEGWHAGSVYVTNLLRALQMIDGNDIEFSLILPKEETYVPEELRCLVRDNIVYPRRKIWSASWLIEQGFKRVFRHDFFQDRFLRRHHVNVIVLGEAPKGSKIPTLSWLPDFQHRHLPEMFSPAECKVRNLIFMQIAFSSTKILLLSESVNRDFKSFAPEHAHKAVVLSPVTYIPTTTYATDPESIADFYHLPDKFIYLPNQFWKHKNHITTFQALKILKDRGTEIFLVCSGNLTDYRHPDYWSRLLQEISQLGIRNQIAILGLVPREHVFQLIRKSICVLNPSLFEGYGMTVDEARSLGKQVLLSEIPVHREQNPPNAVFFDPRNHEDLADKIKLVWSAKSAGPNFAMEEKALQDLHERMKYFAETFMSIVQEVTL